MKRLFTIRRLSFLTLLLLTIQPYNAHSDTKLIMNSAMKKACPKGVLSRDELFEEGAIHEDQGITFQDSPKITFTKECIDIRKSTFIYLIDEHKAIFSLYDTQVLGRGGIRHEPWSYAAIDFGKQKVSNRTFHGIVKGAGKYTYKDKEGIPRTIPAFRVIKATTENDYKIEDDSDEAGSTEEDKNSALIDAATAGNVKKISSLITRGADPNTDEGDGRTPLARAIEGCHASASDTLLSHGANPNQKLNYEQDQTLLMLASKKGCSSAVDALIKKGADVNATDRRGTAVMIYAVIGGSRVVVKTLLDHGADPNVTDKADGSSFYRGMTALEIATSRNAGFPRSEYAAIVDLLLSAGKKASRKPEKGLLLNAVRQGDSLLVTKLLDSGADANERLEKDGMTPLFQAVCSGKETTALVRVLLDRGAEVNGNTFLGRHLGDVVTYVAYLLTSS